MIGHQDEKNESSYKSVFFLVIRILRMKPYFNENPKLVFFTSLMRIPGPNSFFFILVPLSRLQKGSGTETRPGIETDIGEANSK